MAKSLRSKWKRKMRAIKRVKYGAKELEKLKEVVALDKIGKEDFPMKDLVHVTDSKAQVESERGAKTNITEDGEGMDVDSKHDRKTMKDENGQYPAWMNQRQMRKQKKKNIKRSNKGKKAKTSKRK